MALAQQTGQNVCKTPEFGSPLADGEGKLFFKDCLLEGKLCPFRTAGLFQLGKKEALCQKVQKN